MTTYIYGLIDPNSHKVCYIGRTVDLYARLDAHIEEMATSIKGEWMRRLRASNIRPTVIVLDQFEDGPESEIESWWIEFGRSMGWPLTNTLNMKSSKYNLDRHSPYGGAEGHWDSGVWVSDELPDYLFPDDDGPRYILPAIR